MKKGIALATALLLSFAAQAGVQTVEVGGRTRHISDALPAEVIGTYLYEGKGEPIVRIDADGGGLFQRHDVPATPIHAWVEVDESGAPVREVGSEERYRYTLVIQYGEGSPFDAPGSYDLVDITILRDEGRAIALGERFRDL